MNIKKKYSKIIWIIVALSIITLGVIAFFLLTQHRNESQNLGDTSGASKDSGDTKQVDNPATDQKDDSTQSPTIRDQDQKKDDKYVNIPISNPPAVNDPYPIENEHYKISQSTSTKYHITLYPIANSPSQSSYQAQLKTYKTEALSYLKKRYGNIDKFVIEWTPSDAKNV